VAGVPGVSKAAFVWGLPLTGNKWSGDMSIPGQPGASRIADRITLPLRSVTSDYFDLMGMRIVEGRGFRDSDEEKAPRVAVVNEAFARTYFGDATPIGRQLTFIGDEKRPIEIVGLLADTRTEDLSAPAAPEVYFSFWQNGAFSKHLVARVTGDPLPMADAVRRAVRAVDPTSSVERVTTMTAIHRESMSPRTFAMRLLAGFAVTATLLALVGLYGVLSLSVGARTKEIAVRKAIGAGSTQVAGLVLGEGLRLTAVGLVFGVVAAMVVGRLLQSLLFNVKPTDPLTLAAAAGVFGLAALIACLWPAIRAARVDLMEALRLE
jgi:putative ABC transport system permease protein